MQERQADRDEGAGPAAAGAAPGWILEGSDGVGITFSKGQRPIASFYVQTIESRAVNDIPVRLMRGRLLWSHSSSILLLQGSTIAQLLSPLHLVRGRTRPMHHPRPGVDDAVVAEVKKEMSQKEVFLLLSSLI